MSLPETVEEAIEQAALRPKSVSSGGHSVTQHSIDDLVKALDHTATTTAATKPHFGLRFARLIPPGCG